MPPIEAMQLGVPVVCSNTSSLPEVCGDAAILVDPNSEEEIASTIAALLSNKEEQKRLIKFGKSNVKRFGWSKIDELYWKELLD